MAKFLEVVQKGQEVNHKLKKLFEFYDKDHNGVIDKQEFRALMTNLCHTHGEKLPSDCAIDEIMAAADKNWDGVINYQEFVDFLKDFPLLIELYRDD